MANELLEQESGMDPDKIIGEAPTAPEATGFSGDDSQPMAPAGEIPEPVASTGRTAPAEDQEPSVFAPSIWSRKQDRAASANTRKAEDQARRARREADRQSQETDRETKKLELQLAREERKAREEERRREQKRLDEERRQERRAREEADRQFRREERANQKTVRRVGTMTLGLSLIAIGVAVLLYMIRPNFDLRIVAYLAPIILIGLGLETLIRYFFSKDRTYRFDFASGVICILLVIGSCFIALIPELMYYVSPQRFVAEDQLLQAEKNKIYQALQGEQRVADYYVNGGVEMALPSARKDEAGNWVYQLQYAQTYIQLLDGYESEEAFAKTCRELLDKLLREDLFQNSFTLRFRCPENQEGVYYELNLDNRLQLEMNAESLVKLVDPIYSVPTAENGWYPSGYEDIADAYGLEYANYFSHLTENYSIESASIFYNLLMNDNRPDWAENYFDMVTGQAEQPPVSSGEDEGGDESLPEAESNLPPESDETGAPTEPTDTSPAHVAG